MTKRQQVKRICNKNNTIKQNDEKLDDEELIVFPKNKRTQKPKSKAKRKREAVIQMLKNAEKQNQKQM